MASDTSDGKEHEWSYLMEHEGEAARLERKTDPEVTRYQLRLVGFQPGTRSLDAGAGSGAVAREMAKLAGPKGSSVALDQSEERLAHGRELSAGIDNLEFVQGNLLDPPFPENHFDFVWSRFVFEYLPDPDAVLENLVRVTKPGGKVVIGDLDGNSLWHYPLSQELRDGLDKIVAALEGTWDPYAGRKLLSRFRKLGLVDLSAALLPHNLSVGRLSEDALANWKSKLTTIMPVVSDVFPVGGYEAFVESFLEAISAPDVFSYSALILMQGRKPMI